MILADNVNFLRSQFPQVYSFVQEYKEKWLEEPVQVLPAKNGQPTLQLTTPDKIVYFHSQYDPVHEAERLVSKYEGELQNSRHVLFYGTGLGYHIESIMQRFPHLEYTIFEPYPAAFLHYLIHRNYQKIQLNKAKNIYLDNQIDFYLNHFVSQANEGVTIIPHPVYERLFEDSYKKFLERFKFHLQEQKMSIRVNYHLEKLWIINSLCNFSKVLTTPSIFREKKKVFKNKPVLLVAAGPSLEEEIENLKIIKERGLAYIFAVGSANKALIANQIFPDAVCSYDPSLYNHNVFEEIIENKIDSIPLIFGSSVGFQTLELFPGPKLHMITSQDKVSAYFLGDDGIKGGEMVSDAPSIAVLTLELLYKLGCSKIILVGQNFAYKDNKYYSNGIGYSYRSTELTESDQQGLFEVEGVEGSPVATNEAHTFSRGIMERYIQNMQDSEIINTTQGGAKIEGTQFKSLKKAMEELTEEIVEVDWFKTEESAKAIYDLEYVFKQAETMDKDHKELDKVMIDLAKCIKKLESASLLKDYKQVQKVILKFNTLNKLLYDNLYYSICIQPMVRVEYAIFQKSLHDIQKESNVFEKAKLIIKHFGSYIYACQLIIKESEPFYQVMFQQIEKKKSEKLAMV